MRHSFRLHQKGVLLSPPFRGLPRQARPGRFLPLFFERNEENLPLGWIEKMIQSASRISRQFSSDRMMIEYLENCYLPASEKRIATLANGRLKAAELLPSPDVKE